MSREARDWAWSQVAERNLSSSEALVLLRLAEHADKQGVCWPGIDTVAEVTRVSEKTVRRAFAKFESEGLMTRARRSAEKGPGRAADEVVLALLQADTVSGRSDRFNRTPCPVESDVQPDISSRSTGHPVPFNRTFEPLQPDISSRPYIENRQEPSENRHEPGRVNGIKVTTEETELARSIVTAFATQAQQRFTPDAWQERIVRCLRAHPDLTEADHLAIITAAFRNPWWTKTPDRAPTPAVIYGSVAQFERQLAEWKGTKSTDNRFAKYDQTTERIAI